MDELTGRELDRAVAEAKGWRVAGPEWEFGTCDAEHWLNEDGAYQGCEGSAEGSHIPLYSTDWAAAGPLLEEMAARGKDPSLDCDAGFWVCIAFDDELRGYGKSAPEAIARAYVAWRAATVPA